MRLAVLALALIVCLPWRAESASAPAADRSPGQDPRTPRLFQPPRRPPVPAVRDAAWVRNPIDAFILARLEAKSLVPSSPADRLRLLRRVTFDLTGLPPTVEEQEAFLRDDSPGAYRR